MKKELSVAEVKELITKAEASFRHEDCQTCECYLGYIAQLMIDSDQEAKDFLSGYMTPREEMHACLGCDPCSPGILHDNYLRSSKRQV